MLSYPSIEGSSKAPLGKPCIAFYKYDGSNLRFEWQRKGRQWMKYGTRTQLFNASTPTFGPAISVFHGTASEDMAAAIGDQVVTRVTKKYPSMERIIAFCEWFGPKSFAGIHTDEAKDMELRLIDVSLYKKGFMPPREFVKTFGSMRECAQVIYEGNLNRTFIDDVRKGVYPVWEGVVAKGEDFMVKIKTDAYFKKLNEVYGTAYRLYWE